MFIYCSLTLIKFVPVGANQTESESNEHITPEVANDSIPGTSSGHDTQECDDGSLHHTSRINGEIASADSDSQCPNVSINDTCGTSGSLVASLVPNISVSVEETACRTEDKRNESASDSKCDVNPSSSRDALEVENKTGLDSPAEDNTQSCTERMDDTCAVGVTESKVPISDDETYSQSGDKTAASASDSKTFAISTMDYSAVDMGNKTVSLSYPEKDSVL